MIPFDTPIAVGAPLPVLSSGLVRTALELQARGWEIACARGGFDKSSTERLIAGHFKTGMVAAKQERGVFAIIAEAVGTRSGAAPEEPNGEADLALWFYRSFDDNDPHLIIECKRVAETDAYLIREYVSEGIDRFLKGHYRPGGNGCFMTGFMIGGSATGIVTRVNKYLTKKRRSGCHLKNDLAHQDLGSIFTSDHVPPGVTNMKHNFFEVPDAANTL